MINCPITIYDIDGNERIVNYDELKSLILKEGIAALHPLSPDNKLAKAIQFKFDTQNMEDSIMEMLAKLEAKKQGIDIGENPDPDIIDELLYPKGDLNEFLTQLKIKENTDVGTASTGISANSGKTLAYTFEAEPIEELFVKEGNTFVSYPVTSTYVKDLLKSNNVNAAEDLVSKWPDTFKVAKLADAKLKSKYAINYSGKTWDRLSRFELNPYTGAVRTVGDFRVSLFETIDTMINLSIDNVKEQKLFLLGINVNNANSFFAALSLGIPLHDVVLMFKQDVVQEISKKGRISKDSINTELSNLEQLFLENLRSTKKDAKVTKEGEAPSAYSKDLIDKVASSLNVKAKDVNSFINAIESQGGLSDTLISKVKFDFQTLKDLYTQSDKLSPAARNLVEMALLHNLKKLSRIGYEFFTRSQQLGILKGLPSSRWKSQVILQSIEDLNSSSTEKAQRKRVEELFSQEVATALEEQGIKTEITPTLNDMLVKSVPQDLVSKMRTNALIRRRITRDFSASKSSVFLTNSFLRIPNFFSAYRSLVQFTSLIDKTFPIHLPMVREFARDILSRANMNDTFMVSKTVEFIQRQFMTYLSTGLTLDIDGNILDLTIKPQEGVSIDSWALTHVENTVRATREFPENNFLNAIEKNFENELVLVGDKSKDEASVERIRRDFKLLYENDSIIPNTQVTGKQLALDMFKYAIMTQGLYFGRTSLSLIFPEAWAGIHSKALKTRLSTVLTPKVDGKDSAIQTNFNLENLKPVFLYQFLRNQPNLVRYIPASLATPTVQSKVTDEKQNVREIYNGFTEIDGKKVYYDLEYEAKNLSVEAFPKFIRRYDSTIYIKLNTPSKDFAYYRILIEDTEHKAYQFEDDHLSQSLDLDKLADPYKAIVPIKYLVYANKKYHLPNPQVADLNEGDLVYVVDRSAIYPKNIKVFKISAIKENMQILTTNYPSMAELTITSSIDVTNESKIKEARMNLDLVDKGVIKALDTVTKTANDAIRQARIHANENAIALVGSHEQYDTTAANVKVIPMDFKDKEKGVENVLNALEDIVKEFNENPLMYVSENFLDILDQIENKEYFIQVAEALKNMFNIQHPAYSKYLNDVVSKSVELSYKRQRIYNTVINQNLNLADRYNSNAVGFTTPSKSGSGASHVISWKNFKKIFSSKQINYIVPGIVLDLGKNNDTKLFAYVRSIKPNNEVEVNLFGFSVFDYLSKDRYTPEEFDQIQEKSYKENC